MSSPAPSRSDRRLSIRLVEIFRNYFALGFISFGGPGVHVVILRKRFVGRWLDATTFQDLFSLGNALPGPASTQLAFSIGVARGGTLAGLLAFFLWSLPGAFAMVGLGLGVRSIPNKLPPIIFSLFTGLNAAAVGLIAVAAVQLSKSAVTDPLTRLIVLGSASFGICYHAPWIYPVLVSAGGILTITYDYRETTIAFLRSRLGGQTGPVSHSSPPSTTFLPTSASIELQERNPKDTLGVSPNASLDVAEVAQPSSSAGLRQRRSHPIVVDEALDEEPLVIMTPNPIVAAVVGTLMVILVVSVIVVRARLASPPRALDFFANMLIAGVIIFGGGPVVIPLLRGYTVDNGWVSSRDFLLGFAVLNAMPGPNFNYAAFLGVLSLPSNPVLGAILGYIGIFAPGICLKLALLPIYKKWRQYQWARSVLRGLNAAAAGLVYTAVYALFLVGYIYTPAGGPEGESTSASLTSDPFWAVVSACAFVASLHFNVPPFFSIAGGALAGLAWYGVTNQ